jgi:GNAT superfamily N-acetyltransferase
MSDHPMVSLLSEAGAGRFPEPDGSVTVWPPLSAWYAGVFAFTAHTVICSEADPAWVHGQLPPGDLAAPTLAPFLTALSARTGRRVASMDIVCAGPAQPGPPGIQLAELGGADHPRVARALRYREDVRAWQADGGVVLIGRGVAGRWEVATEVDPARRNNGLGRALVQAARHLVPGGATLWAQIAPGNAASVRAFLAAGYQPVCSEALLLPA